MNMDTVQAGIYNQLKEKFGDMMEIVEL